MDIQTYTDTTRSLLGERVVFPRGGELPPDFWERDYWAELELVSTDADGTKLMRARAPKSKNMEGKSWLRKLVKKYLWRPFKWSSEQARGRTRRTA